MLRRNRRLFQGMDRLFFYPRQNRIGLACRSTQILSHMPRAKPQSLCKKNQTFSHYTHMVWTYNQSSWRTFRSEKWARTSEMLSSNQRGGTLRVYAPHLMDAKWNPRPRTTHCSTSSPARKSLYKDRQTHKNPASSQSHSVHSEGVRLITLRLPTYSEIWTSKPSLHIEIRNCTFSFSLMQVIYSGLMSWLSVRPLNPQIQFLNKSTSRSLFSLVPSTTPI